MILLAGASVFAASTPLHNGFNHNAAGIGVVKEKALSEVVGACENRNYQNYENQHYENHQTVEHNSYNNCEKIRHESHNNHNSHNGNNGHNDHGYHD